jgi:hypothetical protein
MLAAESSESDRGGLLPASQPVKTASEFEQRRTAGAPKIESWNFGPSSSTAEEITSVLGSVAPVVVFSGNDLLDGKWPSADTVDWTTMFTSNYVPTVDLQNLMPAECRNSLTAADCGMDNVMHLRRGDGDLKDPLLGVFKCKDPYRLIRQVCACWLLAKVQYKYIDPWFACLCAAEG